MPGAGYTAKVMCFPTWHLAALRSRAARLALADRYLDIDISLDTFEEWPHGYPAVLRWALQASPRATGEYLVEKGRRDARAWVVATGLDALLAGGAGTRLRAREAEDHRRPQRAPGDGEDHDVVFGAPSAAASSSSSSAAAAGKDGGGGEPVVPGLTGKPRTDTAPLHREVPAGAQKDA